MKPMGQMKNSHSLCEKLAGPTTSPSWKDAGTIRSQSSTFGAAGNMAGTATCLSTKLKNIPLIEHLVVKRTLKLYFLTQFRLKQNWQLRMSTPLLFLTWKTSIANESWS